MATALKSTKTAPATVPPIKSKGELEKSLSALGTDMIALADLQNRIARQKKRIEEAYAADKKRLTDSIKKRADRIADFCGDDEHRSELLSEDRKTVELPTGKLSFYFGPTAVVTESGDDEPVIEYCKKRKIVDALRVTTTLDREWIEKNRDTVEIEGVTFEQTEFLAIVPSGFDDKTAVRRQVRVLELE